MVTSLLLLKLNDSKQIIVLQFQDLISVWVAILIINIYCIAVYRRKFSLALFNNEFFNQPPVPVLNLETSLH